jgi:hypothetical protein
MTRMNQNDFLRKISLTAYSIQPPVSKQVDLARFTPFRSSVIQNHILFHLFNKICRSNSRANLFSKEFINMIYPEFYEISSLPTFTFLKALDSWIISILIKIRSLKAWS